MDDQDIKELDKRLRDNEFRTIEIGAMLKIAMDNQKQIIETQKTWAKAELQRAKNDAMDEIAIKSLTTSVARISESTGARGPKSIGFLSTLPAFIPHILITALISAFFTAISVLYWVEQNVPKLH